MVGLQASKTNKGANEHGERKRARGKRHDFIKGDHEHHRHAKAAIDDKIRKTQDILGKNQKRQSSNSDERRAGNLLDDITAQSGAYSTTGRTICTQDACERTPRQLVSHEMFCRKPHSFSGFVAHLLLSLFSLISGTAAGLQSSLS